MGDNVPAALDTLKEIATELDKQGNATSALVANLANKANSSDVYTRTETESKISTAIQNAQIGGDVTIDSSLSSTSTNPVQNKVIYNALNGKVNTGSLSSVATSGKYSDLTGTPTIPSKTSDLTNDSGFLTTSNVYTKAEVNTAINNKKASVTNANATLTPGTNNISIGSIDGTAITVNVPTGGGGSADLSNLKLGYDNGTIELKNENTVLTTTRISNVYNGYPGLMSAQDYCLLINSREDSLQETVYNSANITIEIGQKVSSTHPYAYAVTYYSKDNDDTPNPTTINFNSLYTKELPLSGVVYYFEVAP